MRILQVNNTDLAGCRFNGYDLMKRLNETDHEAWQLVINKQSNDQNVETICSTQNSKIISQLTHKLGSAVALFPFGDFLQDHPFFHKAELVHYHLIHNINMSLPSFARAVSLRPSIWSLHDAWAVTGWCTHLLQCQKYVNGCKDCPLFLDKSTIIEPWQLWKMKEQTYRQLDIDVVVGSPWMQRVVTNSPLGSLFREVHYIPFGIDILFFRKQNVSAIFYKKHNIPRENPIVFFRCQYDDLKGLQEIQTALAMLPIDFKLTVLTCGSKLINEYLCSRFHVIDLGWIDEETLRDAMSVSTLFLMPSIGETFGFMAVEAMACECPIIVCDGTSLPETTFAPHCGLNVPLHDAPALCAAIQFLLNNPEECQKRTSLGRSLAEKHYNREDYFAKMFALYEDVLSRKG